MSIRNRPWLPVLCTLLLAIVGCKDVSETDGSTRVLGDVQFETSCDNSVVGDLNDAVAMLHSFEFDDARSMFESIVSKQPDCAMASWGVAMTYYHPLWAPPTAAELKLGSEAVARARSLQTTAREALYIEAIAAIYDDSEHTPHRERARRYERAMAELHQQYPRDKEAEIFYALAILSNADPTDKTYLTQRRSGGMLEPLFVEMPKHPGVTHYIIHSYDYPDLADRAVDAAHRYLEIATSMPHALHMSGHIFTQLGMWEESIDANTRSAAAARARGDQGQGQLNEIHALDYLVYAYLQRGEDDAAGAIVVDISSRTDLNWRNGVVAFNAGAAPVRFALERRDWQAAASLALLETAEKIGGNDEVRNAIVMRYWGRILGAARIGRVEQAERELIVLEELVKELARADRIWARNTAEVFRLQATAWLALAKNDSDRAVNLMRAAAELEDRTDKSPLSPGHVLPAREQLGDMLTELGRPEEALAEYEAAIMQAPRRFNSLLGAARAATRAGQSKIAHGYYENLLKLASEDSVRTGLIEARNAINETPSKVSQTVY